MDGALLAVAGVGAGAGELEVAGRLTRGARSTTILEGMVEFHELPEQALSDLLSSCYDAGSLRQFVAVNYPKLAQHLPGGVASDAELAFATVQLLSQHGEIQADLFTRLLQKRPNRHVEVIACAQRFKITLSTTPPDVAGSASLTSTPPVPNARPFVLAAAALVVIEAWVWFDDRPGASSQRTGEDFLLLVGMTIALVAGVFAIVRRWRRGKGRRP